MECAQARKQIEQEARGALDPGARKDLKAHLQDCQACRKAGTAEQAFHSALQVTLKDADPKDAELLTVAAGYREPRKRWTLNIMALVMGLIIAILLVFILGFRISFEDLLVLHHVSAVKGSVEITPVEGRGRLAERLKTDLGFEENLPSGHYEGSRIFRVNQAPAAQILMRDEGEPVSIFILPPTQLGAMGDLEERLSDGSHWSGTLQEHTVAVRRGRNLVALVGKMKTDRALEMLLPFRGD